MSYSTRACVGVGPFRSRRSQKSISPNFFGAVAVAGLLLGSGWTVYSNIFRADVFPALGDIAYDAPVKRPAPAADQIADGSSVAVRRERDAGREPAIASLPRSAAVSFNDRFAAASRQGVEPQPQPASIAEASKQQAEAPKLAAAPKAKESAPAQVASIAMTPPRGGEARPGTPAKASIHDMAQRAKAAVMSLASSEKQTIVEKLWGKQPSHSSLLAFASADASVTGSLGQVQNPALGGSAPYDRTTAVYDISAHTVYLPDGTQLEAHSGLGNRLDDPRSANIRMHGVTPPHIYELKPREALFHGVAALRMTPIGGEEAIFGRSGLLAHTYMLGPNGDSNGCVSFKDYDAFLNAYRNQGIKRLAVVAKVE
jgi:Protein of unknown function (DUF2778)